MIGAAEQHSSDLVYVYGDEGRLIHQFSGELRGFTSKTVMVKVNSGVTQVLDESGRLIRQI